ncbi:MAG: hypothetical protein AB1351_02310 [Thermoproteota archaeon]
MGFKSKRSPFENRVYLDKISKLARDLNPTQDTLLFVQQMVSLSALLNSYDRSLGNSFPAIDDNAQDPTYFVAAYLDTKNIVEALWVYRIVKSLTRYILLSDRFYETRNDRYALLAKQVRNSVIKLLQSERATQHLDYSIDYLLGQFSQFWKFEQIVKRRILKSNTFSYSEIRHFNLSKSSDALLVYAKVLDAKLPTFNENVASILHYNQALLDIQDDWEDIEDDVREDMPNIFVMAAVDSIPYSRIKESRHDEVIRKVVLNGTDSPRRPIGRLVDELQNLIKGISIPENFSFLKILSDRYADTLRTKISLADL